MDLVKNVGTNAGKKVLQNLGFVEKAVITVYLKSQAQQLRKSADIVSSKGRIENAAIIMANAIATQALQNVAEGTQSAADATAKITSALDTIGAENMPEIPSPATLARGSAKIFTVQFNPAELRVSGSGGTKKSDLDNIVKAVADALNEIAYHDDSSICELHAAKYYSDQPRVEVKLWEISNEETPEICTKSM